jgi:hypothetical protein
VSFKRGKRLIKENIENEERQGAEDDKQNKKYNKGEPQKKEEVKVEEGEEAGKYKGINTNKFDTSYTPLPIIREVTLYRIQFTHNSLNM